MQEQLRTTEKKVVTADASHEQAMRKLTEEHNRASLQASAQHQTMTEAFEKTLVTAKVRLLKVAHRVDIVLAANPK